VTEQDGDTSGSRARERGAGGAAPDSGCWELRLYIAGNTPNCSEAQRNLERICSERLGGAYRIEIVDLEREPWRARSDQVLAIPTVVRITPQPSRKVVGNLSDTERVLRGLELPDLPGTTPGGVTPGGVRS